MASATTDLSLPTLPGESSTGQAGRPSPVSLEQARPRALWRLPLWSGLLVLTSLILAYPVNLRLEPAVLWSPDVIPNLPIFGALIYLWMACLLVLLFTPSNDRVAVWERLTLVALAALVFRGFWVIVSAVQHQGLLHLKETKDWLEAAQVIPHYAYAAWPGLSLTTAALGTTTGLQVYPAATLHTVLLVLILAICGYTFLLTVLRSSLYAALACLVVLAGDTWLHVIYFPWIQGLVLSILFIMGVVAKSSAPPRQLVALLLFSGIVATHIFGAILAFAIVVSIWAVERLTTRKPESELALTTVALYFVILVGWHLYWGEAAFGPLVRMAYAELSNLQGWLPFGNTLATAQEQVAGGTAFWVSWSRLFAFVLEYALPALFFLWNLRRMRHLSGTTRRLMAAYFALGVLTVAVALLVRADVRRTLTYSGFISISLLFLLLDRLGPLVRKTALVALSGALFILSLPMFLTPELNSPRFFYYPPEHAFGQWLQSVGGRGTGMTIYADAPNYWIAVYYVPNAIYKIERSVLDFKNWTDSEVAWQVLIDLLDRFQAPSSGYTSKIFIEAPKMRLYTGYIFGLAADDPRWQEMHARLTRVNDHIYDNGPVALYAAVP